MFGCADARCRHCAVRATFSTARRCCRFLPAARTARRPTSPARAGEWGTWSLPRWDRPGRACCRAPPPSTATRTSARRRRRRRRGRQQVPAAAGVPAVDPALDRHAGPLVGGAGRGLGCRRRRGLGVERRQRPATDARRDVAARPRPRLDRRKRRRRRFAGVVQLARRHRLATADDRSSPRTERPQLTLAACELSPD